MAFGFDSIARLLGELGSNTGVGSFTTISSGTLAGETITADDVMRVAPVFSAVSLISTGLAQLPTSVVNLTDGLAISSPVSDVFINPNPFQNQFQFINSVVQSMLTWGSAYILVSRLGEDFTGDPVQMSVLNPRDIEINVNSTGMPIYSNRRDQRVWTTNQIIHIKDTPARDFGPEGASRVILCANLIGRYKAAERYESELYKNAARPGGMVTTPAVLTEDQAVKIKSALADFKAGGSQAGNTIVLDAGARFESVSPVTPANANMTSSIDAIIREIAGIMRVPAGRIGSNSDQKYNNVSQANTAMYRDTYAPMIANMEQSITDKLLGPGEWFRFDVSSLINGDLAAQIANVGNMADRGIITVNEARQQLGYEPIADGDALMAPRAPATPATSDQSTGNGGGGVDAS